MKFSYIEIPSRHPTVSRTRRPYLPIRLIHANSFQDLWCLVDSGADVCLLPASIGRLIGIDIENGRRGEIGGVGDQPITVYYHPIRMIVSSLSGVDLEAAFTDSKGVRTGILGQAGFFDHYRITFERYRNTLDVSERRSK